MITTTDRRLLRYEHLVRVNDQTVPRSAWLTRPQLWDGLHHTIMVPQSIDPSIDAATIDSKTTLLIQRRIRRGQTVVTDEVQLAFERSFIIRFDPFDGFAGSSLIVRIEEPAPLALFVRFIYELSSMQVSTAEEDQARRSAYQASDIDRMRAARQFIASLH